MTITSASELVAALVPIIILAVGLTIFIIVINHVSKKAKKDHFEKNEENPYDLGKLE